MISVFSFSIARYSSYFSFRLVISCAVKKMASNHRIREGIVCKDDRKQLCSRIGNNYIVVGNNYIVVGDSYIVVGNNYIVVGKQLTSISRMNSKQILPYFL